MEDNVWMADGMEVVVRPSIDRASASMDSPSSGRNIPIVDGDYSLAEDLEKIVQLKRKLLGVFFDAQYQKLLHDFNFEQPKLQAIGDVQFTFC